LTSVVVIGSKEVVIGSKVAPRGPLLVVIGSKVGFIGRKVVVIGRKGLLGAAALGLRGWYLEELSREPTKHTVC
jgi:hypothetical protein